MKLNILLLVLLILFFQSCKEDDPTPDISTKTYKHDIATHWFDMMYAITKKAVGFTPPVAARAFGYAGVALYESVVPGMGDNYSLTGQLNQFAGLPRPDSRLQYDWQLSANAALAEITRSMYANMGDSLLSIVNQLEIRLKDSLSRDLDGNYVQRSVDFGKSIAVFVFEWSKTDGGHECYKTNFPTDYVPPKGPGYWEPTGPQLIPLQPYCGENRSFVPNNTAASQPTFNIPFSEDQNSPFFAQALEVYNVTQNLTPEQETIAEYWSDDPGPPGTPPGHSISISTQLIRLENYNLANAAELYAKIAISVCDAFISCWKTKYTYNLMRPYTYLRRYILPTWTPLLSTPPFPEYTSGHSVQTSAVAIVLSDEFGAFYSFTDRTHLNREATVGPPRTFTSFEAMANEAAISRLYGGIHFREAIDDGLIQGKIIGNNVLDLNWER
ncbi:MAG: vanadium-dependent haloperoxidase [Bacteroidota bacterium]|nr:vanadium-dependent haloperoxidase [Bacteroidota bacterium]